LEALQDSPCASSRYAATESGHASTLRSRSLVVNPYSAMGAVEIP
jgi:hypothetical protein